MNRWIMGTVLFAAGVAAGASAMHLVDGPRTIRANIQCKSLSKEQWQVVLDSAIRKSGVNVQRWRNHLKISIEEHGRAHQSRVTVERLIQEFAEIAAFETSAVDIEIEQHPNLDGLATGCIGGYVGALLWIRFAPRKHKDFSL